MSMPILRHPGATLNLTKVVDSFDASRASAEAAAFYVLDLPVGPCVDPETWLRSMFAPPAASTPAILVPDDVRGLAARALPGTAVYAYDPADWSVRLWSAARAAVVRKTRTVLVVPPYLGKYDRKNWSVDLLVNATQYVPGVLGPDFADCAFRVAAPEFLRHIETTDPGDVAAWLVEKCRGRADAVLVPDCLRDVFRVVRRHVVTDLPFLCYDCTGYVVLLEDAAPPVPDYN